MTSTRLELVLNAIDDANAKDPNLEAFEGELQAKEWLYGQRMSATLQRYFDDASEHLQIAARAQHIERWLSPRADYPEGRSGYKRWRSELSLFHGKRAGEIMAAHGYAQEDIDRVRFLIQKLQLKRDAETQTLEDVICLVFLQYYFEPFIDKHSEEKIIDIVVKTWKKMSDKGHSFALKMTFSEKIQKILKKTLV